MWPLPKTYAEFQRSIFEFFCPKCENTKRPLTYKELKLGKHMACLRKAKD